MPPRGAGAFVLPPTLRRIALTDATTADPGARLVSAITDQGNGAGLRFVVTGGWSGTDPLSAYPHVIVPVKDIRGAVLGATAGKLVMPTLQFIVRASPGGTTDTRIACGFCNESADSGTIDAYFATVTYTGSNRSVGCGTIANGAASLVTNANVATGTIGIVQLNRALFGASARQVGPQGFYTSDYASGAAWFPASATVPTMADLGGGAWWFFLAVGRSAATAGNVTVDIDLYEDPTEVGLALAT